MHAWEQIQVTVDYIEEHLAEKIKIEHLAPALPGGYLFIPYSMIYYKPSHIADTQEFAAQL